jgi:mevalonate kinase
MGEQFSAAGKAILFGEHAVVYGQPAIAVPVDQVRARATATQAEAGSGLTIIAADLGREIRLAESQEADPLALAARLTLSHLESEEPNARITIRSSIPMASGLGSGAAVAAALVRALAGLLDRELAPAEQSAIVYEVERLHHGTPSGIDNSVIAYEQPIYFVQGRPAEPLGVGSPFTLVIGDTGVRTLTKDVVALVRSRRQRNPARYDVLFDQIGDLASAARDALVVGDLFSLGSLMDENHELLIDLGVSSRELDNLVEAARYGGAIGAKLSGAGQGGNMIALVGELDADEVAAALQRAGASNVIKTEVQPHFA